MYFFEPLFLILTMTLYVHVNNLVFIYLVSRVQLAFNTWGSNWGEKGLFKILRGENECDIETFVVAAWARPVNKASYRNANPFRF